MSTNLTIDDSSPDIIYSNNWATQSSTVDPNTEKFFQATYHSAQADGASANLTFIGSAIYLYGSKGPGHANYSVQFDNFIIFFSANQSETEYQQSLFTHTFNTSGTHFVSLTSRQVSSTNNWLDLDYITITVNETDSNSTVPSASASAPTASPTISPPWLLESSSTAVPSSTSSTTTLPSPTNSALSSTTSKVSLILAAVFGSIIAAALIFGLGFLIARRGKRRRDDQMPLRVDTPATGTTADAFTYKPPPSPPSFFGGQMSPASAELYSEHSPASRTDPFHSELSPGLDHAHEPRLAHGAVGNGRRSPHSTVSMGGATVLTAASTAQLLNPHLHKTSVEPTPDQAKSGSPDAVSRPRWTRTRNPFPHPRQTSDHLPIFKQRRVLGSESAISALKDEATEGIGAPAVVVLGTGINTKMVTEKVGSGTADVQARSNVQFRDQPVPLIPLHAAHRSGSDISTNAQPAPADPPQRPKRPGDGLLDFIGSQLAQRLERSASAKRRRDDANSERTNFLKV